MSFAPVLSFSYPAWTKVIREYEGIRENRGRMRPPGDGLSLQNSRGSPWLPGARRRAAHLSNLPGDIPQEILRRRRRIHILHGRPAPPSTSLHRALHRICVRACGNYPAKLHAKLSHGHNPMIKRVTSNSPGRIKRF